MCEGVLDIRPCLIIVSYSVPNYKSVHYILPPSQIVSHSKNLGESNFSKFDQIYIIK